MDVETILSAYELSHIKLYNIMQRYFWNTHEWQAVGNKEFDRRARQRRAFHDQILKTTNGAQK